MLSKFRIFTKFFEPSPKIPHIPKPELNLQSFAPDEASPTGIKLSSHNPIQGRPLAPTKAHHSVTLSRSEGSVALGVEMLRCAQHDSAVTHTDTWINVFMCIIGPRWLPRFLQPYAYPEKG